MRELSLCRSFRGRGSADSDCRRCGIDIAPGPVNAEVLYFPAEQVIALADAQVERARVSRGRLGERRCARLVLERGIWDGYWVRRETSLHSERNQRPPREYGDELRHAVHR